MLPAMTLLMEECLEKRLSPFSVENASLFSNCTHLMYYRKSLFKGVWFNHLMTQELVEIKTGFDLSFSSRKQEFFIGLSTAFISVHFRKINN